MKRTAWLLLLTMAGGCIHGAPLPPTPTSSLAVNSGTPDRQVQESEYVQIARTYLSGLGKDPTQATYTVRATPHREEGESSDGPATIAVVDVDFLDGNVWHLAITADGQIAPLSGR